MIHLVSGSSLVPSLRRPAFARLGLACLLAGLAGSAACTLTHEPYPYPDIWDPLARIFDAWGFDRCLWGTDWTRASAVVNYEQATRPFLETSRLSESERAMLMGGACAKAYRWSPTGRAPR